jgi:hypothetical protein
MALRSNHVAAIARERNRADRRLRAAEGHAALRTPSEAPVRPDGPRRAWPALAALAATAAVVAAGSTGCADGDDGGAGSSADRRAEVADRGAEVMPFDLEATTHRFRPTDDGLVQTVVADDPDDREQVELVRRHLADEAERFAAGDYDDPASIHGDEMPGLVELRAGAADIEVAYAEVDAGAAITYTTDDAELVAALHDWAEAQVADHGDHAEHADDPDHTISSG